jgi:glycine/D-amino acid oxidase-like deaminating enzyme
LSVSNRPAGAVVTGADVRAECDVVVAGGGITGAATAYYLSLAGMSVTLVEQFDLNTQASGRNAGSLHGQIQFEPFRLNPRRWALDFLPALSFLVESVEIWKGLSEELETDLEVSTNGGLLVAETDEQATLVAEKVELEAQHGFPAELVTGAELRRLAPYLSPRIVAAEFSWAEGKTNPLLAAPAFARAAERNGARIHTGTTVRRVRRSDDGFEVMTTAGAIRCSRVVLSTGSELNRLAAELGVDLPITDEPVQVHATEAVAPVIPHLVYYAGGRLTLKQARAGTLLVGGGWPASVDPETGHPTVSADSMRGNLRVAQRVAPWIGSVNVIRAWAGVGNGTPDLLPLIGESPIAPGAFIAMFPHMGLTGGPLMGQVLAALVRGKDPGRDLTPFALDRFAR